MYLILVNSKSIGDICMALMEYGARMGSVNPNHVYNSSNSIAENCMCVMQYGARMGSLNLNNVFNSSNSVAENCMCVMGSSNTEQLKETLTVNKKVSLYCKQM